MIARLDFTIRTAMGCLVLRSTAGKADNIYV